MKPPDPDPPGAAGLVPDPCVLQATIGRTVGGRSPAPREEHFLVPPFGEPIRLNFAAGRPLVLGRDDACQVRMASATVSRKHAEIIFRGRPARAYLRDLGTVNGTRLNGAIVTSERTLEDGDVIRLGEVTAIYKVRRPGKHPTPDPIEAHAATLMMSNQEVGENGKGLSGDVALLPLPDVLGRLTVLRETGTFVVDVDGSCGRISFVSGRITGAAMGEREGDAALRTITALTRGTFRFERAPLSSTEAVRRPSP